MTKQEIHELLGQVRQEMGEQTLLILTGPHDPIDMQTAKDMHSGASAVLDELCKRVEDSK